MASVHDRAVEIIEDWHSANPNMDPSCHSHTGCWFYAMSLAYYEHNKMAKAAQYATLAMCAWLAPTRAYYPSG